MRIAVVHSFYSGGVPSGENRVVMDQVRALQEFGHEVVLLSKNSDLDAIGLRGKIRAGITVLTGRGASPIREIRDFAPDVVHVHNLFPNYGLQWVEDLPFPLVATLHNFRPLCMNGLLLRDGHHCFECPSLGRLQGVVHRCYRDSIFASATMAIGPWSSIPKNPLFVSADAVIVPGATAANVYLKHGYVGADISVIPNFVPPVRPPVSGPGSDRFLFVGRLSSEKGVSELLDVWPNHFPLDIVGGGPLHDSLREKASRQVRLLGALGHAEVIRLMQASAGVVIPSTCLEVQPTVALEALAAGVPVVAHASNAAGDLVREHSVGATYTDGASLSEALQLVVQSRDNISRTALEVYMENFSPEAWRGRIEYLYDRVRLRK